MSEFTLIVYFEKEIRGKYDRRFQNSSETSIGDLPARIDVPSRDLYIIVVSLYVGFVSLSEEAFVSSPKIEIGV